MTAHAVILTTAGSRAEATSIASALVERRLAACVNVVQNVVSTYRWKGSGHVDDQWLLIVKKRRERLPEVRIGLRELHSYEQPEAILLPIEDGDPAYLAWIDENVS